MMAPDHHLSCHMALLQSQGLTGRSHGFQEGRINLSNADKNLRNPGLSAFTSTNLAASS